MKGWTYPNSENGEYVSELLGILAELASLVIFFYLYLFGLPFLFGLFDLLFPFWSVGCPKECVEIFLTMNKKLLISGNGILSIRLYFSSYRIIPLDGNVLGRVIHLYQYISDCFSPVMFCLSLFTYRMVKFFCWFVSRFRQQLLKSFLILSHIRRIIRWIFHVWIVRIF